MKPVKSLTQQVASLDLRQTLGLLAYVQRRRARDEVLQRLLEHQLVQLVSEQPTRTMPDELLKVPEVARVLNVPRKRVYDLIDPDGQDALRSVRLGKAQLRVRRRDLDEYLRQSSKNGSKYAPA